MKAYTEQELRGKQNNYGIFLNTFATVTEIGNEAIPTISRSDYGYVGPKPTKEAFEAFRKLVIGNLDITYEEFLQKAIVK